MKRFKVNLCSSMVVAVLIPLLLTPAVAQAQTAAWSVISSPSPSSSFNFLDAATADPSSGQAWAVGYFDNASSVFQTLTEFNPSTKDGMKRVLDHA